MDGQKSLFYKLAKTYEHHRAERAASEEEVTSRARPGRMRRFFALTDAQRDTLSVVVLLILTQAVDVRDGLFSVGTVQPLSAEWRGRPLPSVL